MIVFLLSRIALYKYVMLCYIYAMFYINKCQISECSQKSITFIWICVILPQSHKRRYLPWLEVLLSSGTAYKDAL